LIDIGFLVFPGSGNGSFTGFGFPPIGGDD